MKYALNHDSMHAHTSIHNRDFELAHFISPSRDQFSFVGSKENGTVVGLKSLQV